MGIQHARGFTTRVRRGINVLENVCIYQCEQVHIAWKRGMRCGVQVLHSDVRTS